MDAVPFRATFGFFAPGAPATGLLAQSKSGAPRWPPTGGPLSLGQRPARAFVRLSPKISHLPQGHSNGSPERQKSYKKPFIYSMLRPLSVCL